MKPLIDSDVLRYEIGFSGEYEELDAGTGETIKHIREWDFVQDLLDNKISFICKEVGATERPVLFITGSDSLSKIINRSNRYSDMGDIEMVEPIRNIIAQSKPYKGTRKGAKPFHFDNITAYVIANYDCDIAWGVEADDRMAQYQTQSPVGSTIICSRDKDLRMVPGWQYGWECGKQPSFGPELIDEKGWLKYNSKGDVKGAGLKFFFYQMLVGDTVDNIPGCPKIGTKGAMKLLEPLTTKREHELAIIDAYKNVYGEGYKEMLQEQSDLLWMIREMNEDGSPVFYNWRFE